MDALIPKPPKMSVETQNMKTKHNDLKIIKNESGMANLETARSILDIVENEFRSTKLKKWTQ
jgi:hypothetical protein